eukprot:CAMPEP_0119468804 /NCGR_PEP_ID=MMETSP1344-20130328/2396_1 /TAXON_ID=236787 /ORGANISM="Florenciella parvula, Strain CCMP2471" /LENGTH=150 /DNA_ID=CAMNT_0007501299 /DNA_START=573 /DNA_END=1025 /DNA_ORIENTATION=+
MFTRVVLLLAMIAGASAFTPSVGPSKAASWTGRADFLSNSFKVAGAVALAPAAAFADDAADAAKKAADDEKAKKKAEAEAKKKAEEEAAKAAAAANAKIAADARQVVIDQGAKMKAMGKAEYIEGSKARRTALMKQYGMGSGEVQKMIAK